MINKFQEDKMEQNKCFCGSYTTAEDGICDVCREWSEKDKEEE